MMDCWVVLVFLVLYDIVPFSSAQDHCPENFPCGKLGTLSFPFSNYSLPDCGLFMVNCSDQISPKIALSNRPYDRWFDTKSLLNENAIKVHDPMLQFYLKSNMCATFIYVTPKANSLAISFFAISFFIESNITVFRCNYDSSNQGGLKDFNSLRNYTDCHEFTIFYTNPKFDSLYSGAVPPSCVALTLPMVPFDSITQQTELFQLFTPDFDIEWHVSDDCVNCRRRMPDRRLERLFLCSSYNTSFGVVLIELISSMRAIDMSRNRHEINLSEFALSRILRGAFEELIDPSLVIEADPEVSRMTSLVAELAYRCLQHKRNMRPSMEEVVENLKAIQSSKHNTASC